MSTTTLAPAKNLPASPEALSFYQQSQSTLENLWARWQDEKEYEDINDYSKPLESIAKKNKVTILKMNKRPFGLNFKIEDGREYTLKCTSTQYSYVRIK